MGDSLPIKFLKVTASKKAMTIVSWVLNAAFAVLLYLKVVGHIGWPWWLVTMPGWAMFALAGFLGTIAIFMKFNLWARDAAQRRREYRSILRGE